VVVEALRRLSLTPAEERCGRRHWKPDLWLRSLRQLSGSGGDPGEDALVDLVGPLEVQEVASAVDDLGPRAGREVTCGVADQSRIDAPVSLAVDVEGWPRRDSCDGGVLGLILPDMLAVIAGLGGVVVVGDRC
jgi:hypothetical protein